MVWNAKIKEEIGYCMAIISLFFGFSLTTAGFCVDPIGEVHGSVLSVLGECFLFAAAVLGISLHLRSTTKAMAADLNAKIERKFSELEEEFPSDRYGSDKIR